MQPLGQAPRGLGGLSTSAGIAAGDFPVRKKYPAAIPPEEAAPFLHVEH
jgi:hypothetical protein